ncbi:MAG: nucleoside triphosphate pyrophosphatase [Pirellulales bacterium]
MEFEQARNCLLAEWGSSFEGIQAADMTDFAAGPLILASQSPRRRQLLTEAGYVFQVVPPDDHAECGICTRESPPEMVARLAFQKAQNVAQRTATGTVVGCDTVAFCAGQILGKPQNVDHAQQMLRLLSGREHDVYSGLCLWRRPGDARAVRVARTTLRMDRLSDQQISEYLATEQWQGKAGAFGYQDGWDWLHIVRGSESNVVGLPMELLREMLTP